MRVSRRSERRDVASTPSGARRKQTDRARLQGVFKANLTAIEEELIEADLNALLADVDQAAHDLKRWRGRTQLGAYRRAVKAFLQVAMGKMYRVTHETRFDRHGGRVSSVIVQAIDKQLEALAAEIISGQESAVPLAARLDEIRGLLLDLYG